MLSKLLRKRSEEPASEPDPSDPWPVRDKFLQNLFDVLDEETQPIFLIYLVSEGTGERSTFDRVIGSAHQYRGGRIMMPRPRREWGNVSHVGVIIDGELKSNWRVTPELGIAIWDIHADQVIKNLRGRVQTSLIGAAIGKIKNPFR